MNTSKITRLAITILMIPAMINILALKSYSQIDYSDWSPPQVIVGPHLVAFYPWVASPMVVDQNGDWHLVYSESWGDLDTDTLYSYINYINESSAAPYVIASEIGSMQIGEMVAGPSLTIDAMGGLHITYSDGSFGGGTSTLYTYKAEDSASWSPPVAIAEMDQTAPRVASPMVIDQNGDWHLAYQETWNDPIEKLVYTYIQYINESSATPYLIASEIGTGELEISPMVCGPSLTIDATGGFHITYSYYSTLGGTSTMYTYKANDSASWSSPVAIVERGRGDPWVASPMVIDQNGDWHLAYQERRIDESTGTDYTYINYINESSAAPYVIASAVDSLPLPPWTQVSGPSLTIDTMGGFHITYSYGSYGSIPEVGVSIMYTYTTLACEGDFNGDRDVDGSDLDTFAGAFGSTSVDPNYNPDADFDADDDVDEDDLAVFAADFGRISCPTP